jgi:hypothetical protein
MRKALPASFLALLALPSLAAAADFEISGFAGYTFPFYSQTFTYQPGPISVPIPGVSIQQSGNFQLDASGGAAYGAAAAFFPVHSVGVELRVDSGDLTLGMKDAAFDVNVSLPAPLQPVHSTLTLTKGTADLRAARPFSLNLKLRSPGRSHVYASGGLSRLGDLELSMRQQAALGVTTVNLETGNLEVGTIDLRAQRPVDKAGSSWGGNLGLGFQIGLGDHGGLVIEGRGFVFPKQTAEWQGVVETPLGDLQKELLKRLLADIPQVEFRPWWVQATIGVAYRF